MKTLLSLFILMFSLSSFAAGGEGTGGGDPIAAHFSALVNYVSDYLERNPKLRPEIPRQNAKAFAEAVADTLHVSSTVGTIEVVDDINTKDITSPFIKAEANPIHIQISRIQWQAFSEKDLLNQVLKIVVKLALLFDPDSIPVPEKAIDSYVKAYERCVRLTEEVEELFQLHIQVIKACTRENFSKVALAQSKINQQMSDKISTCEQSCVYHHQEINGGDICNQYQEQHEENMNNYKRFQKPCVSL